MIKVEKGFKNDKLGLELDVYVMDNSGKAWFKAKDLSDFFGYNQAKDMLRISNFLDDHTSRHNVPRSNGSLYEMTFIDEFLVFEICCKINKSDEVRFDRAQQFQKWVFGEVLPGLRRNGAFVDVKLGETTDDSIEKCTNATLDAHYGITREIERLELALAYEREENSVAKTEIDNLNARNDYLEDENDRLTINVSRLKKIVKHFLDKDKKEFIERNDIKSVPTDTIKYNKFLQDLSSRLVRRDSIYKDIRVPDYYEREEEFYV